MKHTPKRTLNVILIEDSIDDIILIRRQLYKLGWELNVRTCSEASHFNFLIQAVMPDIIISDYRLPGWSGLEARLVAKEMLPSVPFFFVSGAVPESLAEDSALNQADGYILKSNLSALPDAVKGYFQSKDIVFERVVEEVEDTWGYMYNMLVNIRIAYKNKDNLRPYMDEVDNFLSRIKHHKTDR